MQPENNTLYYIYDPMCSWCYAFEQSLTQLQQQLPSELEFKPVLGGLAADSKIPMPAETQAMIQQAWRQIENTVPSVRFNFDFWTKNTPLRSTYPACRAILAAVEQDYEYAQAMRQAIQYVYYKDAKNPSLKEELIACAQQLGLDIDRFAKDLASLEINIKLSEQRHFSRLLGVSSYPSLRLILNSEVHTIAIDYSRAELMLEQINKLCDLYLENTIESPCIRNCCLNNEDICLGCFRSLDEITGWSYYSNAEKQAILDSAVERKTLYNKAYNI